jgi:hypothetical protein
MVDSNREHAGRGPCEPSPKKKIKRETRVVPARSFPSAPLRPLIEPQHNELEIQSLGRHHEGSAAHG